MKPQAIPSTGVEVRLQSIARKLLLCLVFVMLLLVPRSAYCQKPVNVARHPAAPGKQSPPVPVTPPSEELPATAPPVPKPSLEQLPPRAPVVVWNGHELSIRSENATLAEILSAVRERMKATIEIPAGAAAERVAGEFGPGPAREVLTMLLNGSRFDYIIQASDSNEYAVQSVLLSPRGRSDDAARGAALASNPVERQSRDYQASAASSSDGEAESVGAQMPSASEMRTASSASESVQASQESNESRNDAESRPASVNAAASELGSTGNQALAPGGTALNFSGASMPEMAQGLQTIYEQRRLLQAQRNQGNVQPQGGKNP